MQVCLGEQAIPVGTLTYSRQGTRENTSFVYDDTWLESGNRFEISPDLPLTEAAQGRIVYSDGIPIALIRRFDRVEAGRIPYLSATSMLQASREDEHTYSEIAERILSVSPDAKRDLAELWRRIVFNILITNVDDHLNNHGFLHVGHGQWRLAPAFDLNPFPDKGRDLKTWLTEETGPTGKIKDAMHAAGYFHLTDEHAFKILGEVHGAVSQWRQVARNAAVGMSIQELESFDAAFEHEEAQIAKQWLA